MVKKKRDKRMSAAWIPFLFAEDLSAHLLRLHDIEWSSSFSYFAFRDRMQTTFSPEIARAVTLFPDYFEEHLERITAQLTPHVLADSRQFSNFMYYLADSLFSGELFLEFIVYCGCVIHVAKHFHTLGRPEFMDHAVVGIAFTFENKLKHLFEVRGGWKVFRLYCDEIAAIKLKPDICISSK